MNDKRENGSLRRIFARTEGKCHICRKRLCFGNYGARDRKGAWEIEHSIPVSKGGTDHLNNLYAACIQCNRSKGAATTRTARARNGYRGAPLSKKRRTKNAWTLGAAGTLAALFVPPHVRLVAALLGATVGATIGYRSEPK